MIIPSFRGAWCSTQQEAEPPNTKGPRQGDRYRCVFAWYLLAFPRWILISHREVRPTRSQHILRGHESATDPVTPPSTTLSRQTIMFKRPGGGGGSANGGAGLPMSNGSNGSQNGAAASSSSSAAPPPRNKRNRRSGPIGTPLYGHHYSTASTPYK